MTHTTIYTLFMPPQNCYGDFGLLCGFTAAPQVLRQIQRTFSSEVNRPSLAAFIHPTINAISDVPGLAWMWMNKKKDYKLLHAKVALLGFRKRDDAGYVIRLAVSTGNWTQDPLTTSIDLYWHIDVDTNDPDPQSVSDIHAAWSMFNWLRKRADCSLINRNFDGYPPDERLASAIKGLGPSTVEPRFIDSRTQALCPQVVERIGLRNSNDKLVKANSLILGSGYYESEGSNECSLPERLRKKLVKEGMLISRNAWLDLFLNPASCQGLAAHASTLIEKGWSLRRPFSQLHGSEGKLHAKFVLLATGEPQIRGRLYLGSGNLSKAGFEQAAKHGGNLEAGVVVDVPKGLKWNGKYGISRLLPLQFKDTVEPAILQNGEDLTPPEEPPSMPPESARLP